MPPVTRVRNLAPTCTRQYSNEQFAAAQPLAEGAQGEECPPGPGRQGLRRQARRLPWFGSPATHRYFIRGLQAVPWNNGPLSLRPEGVHYAVSEGRVLLIRIDVAS